MRGGACSSDARASSIHIPSLVKIEVYVKDLRCEPYFGLHGEKCPGSVYYVWGQTAAGHKFIDNFRTSPLRAVG